MKLRVLAKGGLNKKLKLNYEDYEKTYLAHFSL